MRRIPGPAERISDLGWLSMNMHILFPAALERFACVGRGCIVVDCTVIINGGNKFAFVPQAEMSPGEPELARMVREYKPMTQMVVHLLKADDNTSTYRVGQV